MIKIEKPEKVPSSLDENITKKYRDEIIQRGKFPDKKSISAFDFKSIKTYENRYKTKNIKGVLTKIYKHKCAYCEQRVEAHQIEHYRPKSIYYWLVYSWDNLLFCCPDCNRHKSNNFPVRKRIDIETIDISEIHKLVDIYDDLESPDLINPEKEDIFNQLTFEKNGKIGSSDKRLNETIKICNLDRDYLNDQRKGVFEELEQKITSRLLEANFGNKNAILKIHGLLEDFMNDSYNSSKDFLSFRKYVVKYWLNELINNYL